MNTFELTLDLDKSVGAKQWVTLRQGDKRGTTLRATLYDHGVLVSGSYTCRVSIRHPNRNTYYRETATYSNGVATVTIDETSAASVVGVTEGYFELLQGSTLIASTESFGVRVLQSATDGATVGPPYDSAIQDALDELDAATGRISQMVVDATAEYLAAHPEITTTVQDNSVTDAKLIQSGGVLDRVGRLWWRLENLLTATPAEAESVTVADAAQTPVAGLTVFGKSTQDGTPTPDAPVAIESVEGNLFDYLTNYNSSSVSLSDGKLVNISTDTKTYAAPVVQTFLNGSPVDIFYIANSSNVGRYGLSFTPTQPYDTLRIKHNGSAHDIWFAQQAMSTPVGQPLYVTLTFHSANASVVGGIVVSDIAVYKGARPRDYAPYGSAALRASGKNVLDMYRYTRNVRESGITFTQNEDGTIRASGTSTSTAQVYLTILASDAARFAGMTLSGAPNVSGCSVRLEKSASPYTAYAVDTGSGATINLPSGDVPECFLYFRIDSGKTVDVTFHPMIRPAGTSADYEPYKESVTAIPLDGHVLRSLPDGTRDEVTVDQYGHAVLVQRVGSAALSASGWAAAGSQYRQLLTPSAATSQGANIVSSAYTVAASTSGLAANAIALTANGAYAYIGASSTLADSTLLYKLATPQTIDLGTIDPIALQGPDMTAQAVPTAPFRLTYERDLNVTLARLEAAIAEVATS